MRRSETSNSNSCNEPLICKAQPLPPNVLGVFLPGGRSSFLRRAHSGARRSFRRQNQVLCFLFLLSGIHDAEINWLRRELSGLPITVPAKASFDTSSNTQCVILMSFLQIELPLCLVQKCQVKRSHRNGCFFRSRTSKWSKHTGKLSRASAGDRVE